MKRILVTGSQGFVGKALVKTLLDTGFQVVEFDWEIGDISTYEFNFEGIDQVVHLASLVFVPASWTDPKSFYQTNLIGTVNVLDFCRKAKCPLTYISSYVYGTPQYLPVDENHPLSPASPYNHSKLLAEDACRFYHDNFGVPVTIFRPVNVFGPGQNIDFLIPKIIRQALEQEFPAIEVIDLRPRRDFIFIDDFVQAIVCSFGRSEFEIFNLGSGFSVSVEDIIKTVLREARIDKPYLAKNEERKNETWDVYSDITKVKQVLGWQPSTSFEQGILHCIEAYKMANTGK